jgi:bifunctional non-homologous end joining protein LigD
MDNVTLRYTEGCSYKEYRASIEPKDGGYVVNFAYGRIGNVCNFGSKTPKPVSLDKAQKVFDALVNSKLEKGYQDVGGNGIKVVGNVDQKVQTGIKPQLLNVVDEEMVEKLIASPGYMAQEKKDGERRMIGKVGSTVTGINRKGQEVGLPEPIAAEIRKFECDLVVDGEQIGEVFWMFDVLECDGEDLRKRPAKDRYLIAAGLCAVTAWPVQIVEAAFDKVGKRNLVNETKASKGEGVVFKDCSAPYTVGRPNSGGPQLKYKFTQSATCLVIGQNGSRRSVALAMATTNNGMVEVGNVTIPVNFSVPPVAALVAIRYLYAYPGGSLYQPVYLGERTDVDVDEYATLKFKQGSEEDEV